MNGPEGHVSSEPDKSVVLRAVNRAAEVGPTESPKEGIAFERVVETACPACHARVPLADAEPLSRVPCPACGQQVFVPGRLGGFLLCGHIGDGEMGSIYRAVDESLGREVAIKLVRGCDAADAESRERLRREACAAGKLNHPRVAQVHALNFSNGQPYLVMELVTGQDFAKKIGEEGRLEERVVLRMALDVADGLTALNREGLVHGDIKPGNIVLDRDGNAKLVDFGLSGMSRLDANGAFVGTPNFVAPELLQGAADTHRSDLYSFGATLYYLLSGRPPFDGPTTIDILKARLTKRPDPLAKLAPRVSAATCKLIMSLLERHPARRPASSEIVAEEIRKILARLDAQAANALDWEQPAASPLYGDSKPSWRRLGVFASVGAVLVAGVWFGVYRSMRVLPEPTSASGTNVLSATDSVTGLAFRTSGSVSGKPPMASFPGFAFDARDYPHPITPVWSSLNLGENTQRGSTVWAGGTVIIQGMGQNMWEGDDRCRFVFAEAGGDYAFSACVRDFAADALGMAGLLLKGDDRVHAPGLFFGLRGNGELFFQARLPPNKTVFIKRSGGPVPLPVFLLLARRGDAFAACVSDDGQTWKRFGVCNMGLSFSNAVGCCVSAKDLNSLATAKFSDLSVSLREPAP